MYINNVLYCFYSSDTEAFEACFRLLHDDDDDDDDGSKVAMLHQYQKLEILTKYSTSVSSCSIFVFVVYNFLHCLGIEVLPAVFNVSFYNHLWSYMIC